MQENMLKQNIMGRINKNTSSDEIIQIIHVAGIAVYLDTLADALKIEVDSNLSNILGK